MLLMPRGILPSLGDQVRRVRARGLPPAAPDSERDPTPAKVALP
jgi:hypothetical protein